LKQGGGVALVAAALGVAVFEFFTALRQRGFQPAILPGAFAAMLLPVVAYKRGADGMLIVLGLVTLTTLLWYLAGVVRDRPAVNIAVTLSGVLYIGLLGGTAGLILSLKNNALGVLLGAVLCTVAYDVVGFFVGANLGQRPLAPDISPNKTWEGLIGGVIAAVAMAFLLSKVFDVAPWQTTSSAIALGLIVAVMAPLGDLTESMLKRDLGLKDMGTLLPGHGGVLDRIDAMLFTVPAIWFLARWKNWI
jgi:phosphatidate cytidylyltransferase